MKLLALNQRLHEIVGDEASSPKVRNDDLHMDMLIDFNHNPVGPCQDTKDILELFNVQTPVTARQCVQVDHFGGSTCLFIDILSKDGRKYLRAFNLSEKDDLKGVEVEEYLFGTIQPLSTMTLRAESSVQGLLFIQVKYQINGQQITEKLSLSLQ